MTAGDRGRSGEQHDARPGGAAVAAAHAEAAQPAQPAPPVEAAPPAQPAPAESEVESRPAPDLSTLLDEQRIRYIEDHGLRSDPPSETLERITDLVRQALGVRASTVTIVSEVQTTVVDDGLGLPVDKVTVPLEESFCARAMATGEPFVVSDATIHPWVRHTEAARSGRVVGYLGAPMFSEEGHPLGAVCAFSDEPREWTRQEVRLVSQLAALATSKLDLQVRNAWLQEALEEVEELANQDPLTGLANRRVLVGELEAALSRGCVTLLAIDLDGFKQVNDRYGHAVADAVLVAVARRLEAASPEGAVVARLGGDEFAVLMPSQTDGATRGPGAQAPEPPEPPAPAQREALAVSLVERLTQPVDVDGQDVAVGASVGVADSGCAFSDVVPSGGAEELLRAADTAMYTAKQAGGGVRAYDPTLRSEALRLDALEEGLRTALHFGQGLTLVHQPIRSLHDGSLLGVESRLRFHHQRLGQVPTTELLALAEQRSLLVALEATVLDLVAEQRERWHGEGLTVPRLWLNVSAAGLAEPAMVDRLVALAAESGAALGVDVSERGLDKAGPTALEGMRRLTQAGVALAVDGFGAGRASLASLRGVPVEAVKLAPIFVAELPSDEESQRLVRGLVALARAMEVTVVAEGIERAEQLEAVQALGCDGASGHALGGPVPEGARLRRMLASELAEHGATASVV